MAGKSWWGAHGFLGEGYALPSPEGAGVHVVPVPCELTVSYGGGTAQGPRAIMEASWNLEVYDLERDRELHTMGIYTHRPVACGGTVAEAHRAIERRAREVARTGTFPVFLGGEHSITPPLVRALREELAEPFTVLCLDAHADMRDEYEGEPGSHACAMRRVREMGVPVVHVGLRSVGPEERDAVATGGVAWFPMHLVRRGGPWQDAVASACGRRVYLSVDVDAFDPSIIPSTGTPEPGGLTWDDVMALFAVLEERGHELVGFDIVELAPVRGLVHPDFLCAKLLYKLLGWKFFPRVLL